MLFMLTIKLGNDAMQTGLNVAEALRRAAHKIDMTLAATEITAAQDDFGFPITDLNGNKVGERTFIDA